MSGEGSIFAVKTRTWWTCPECQDYGSFTATHPDDASWTLTLTERRHRCPAASPVTAEANNERTAEDGD